MLWVNTWNLQISHDSGLMCYLSVHLNLLTSVYASATNNKQFSTFTFIDTLWKRRGFDAAFNENAYTCIFDDYAIFVFSATSEARLETFHKINKNATIVIVSFWWAEHICPFFLRDLRVKYIGFLVGCRLSDMWSILCWKIVGNKRSECPVFIATRKTFPLFYKHPEIYFIHLAI